MTDTENPSKTLVDEYLRLGGKRRAVLDDNLVSTRIWEGETAEADAFWRDHVETLTVERRKDVEKFLPAINAV